MNTLFYTRTLSGHRLSYLNFVIKNFGGERASLRQILFAKNNVFFLMIEDSFMVYFFSSVLRAIFRKKTIGLLFRGKNTVNSTSFRMLFKNYCLNFLKNMSSVTVISIIPFYVDGKIDAIANTWIHDFQFWDLSDGDIEFFNSIRSGKVINLFPVNEIKRSSDKKIIIAAIGKQDKNKGFDVFVNFIAKSKELDVFYPIVAGKIAEDCVIHGEKLLNVDGLYADRHVSDEEIIATYAVCDIIWCVYSDSYDQSSGVLGRALQLKVPVIVRSGSVSHIICLKNEYPFITLSDLYSFIDNDPSNLKNKLQKLIESAKIFDGNFNSFPVIKNILDQ